MVTASASARRRSSEARPQPDRPNDDVGEGRRDGCDPSLGCWSGSHVERLAAADLAHDDAIGTHAERVADQVALRDLAAALEAGDPRLQAHHVRLLQLQLRRVLDRHDALADVDQPRQRVQQSGLAGTGAAETIALSRARDAISSRRATGWVIVPNSISLGKSIRWRANLRIEM
jgi:hypothetical protein